MRIDLTKIDGIQIINFLKENGYECIFTAEYLIDSEIHNSKIYQLDFDYTEGYEVVENNYIYLKEDLNEKFAIQVQMDDPLDDSHTECEIEDLLIEFIKTYEFKEVDYKEKLNNLKGEIYLSMSEISKISDIDTIIENLKELKTYYTKCQNKK